jgi:septum formation protein
LLEQIGVPFQVAAVAIDEQWLPGETLPHYVARLATEKARAAQAMLPHGSVILAADTAGACNNIPLVKPLDEDDAIRMLLTMSGRSHTVTTAISLCCNNTLQTQTVSSDVYFRTISEQEARRYWATGEPADKAGSYAIQGFGSVFVERIEGSYSAVVGLPLHETAALLQPFGIACWQATIPKPST